MKHMTTQIVKQQYLKEHKNKMKGKKWAVYNPNDSLIETLPIIFGFNNGKGGKRYTAQLIAEDGTPLGCDFCTHEDYMEHDLGILEGTRPDMHNGFKKHYPTGYRMEFVPELNIKTHKGLQNAYLKNQES